MYFKEKGEDVKEQVKTIKKFGEEAIFDARSLGGWRFFVLGFQHLFAMFGATVLVPLLTGLPILYITFCRTWNTSVPLDFEKEGSCIPRLFLCIPCGLYEYCTE